MFAREATRATAQIAKKKPVAKKDAAVEKSPKTPVKKTTKKPVAKTITPKKPTI